LSAVITSNLVFWLAVLCFPSVSAGNCWDDALNRQRPLPSTSFYRLPFTVILSFSLCECGVEKASVMKPRIKNVQLSIFVWQWQEFLVIESRCHEVIIVLLLIYIHATQRTHTFSDTPYLILLFVFKLYHTKVRQQQCPN
jgi:hypothetical protein